MAYPAHELTYDSQTKTTKIVCMCGEIFDSFEAHNEHTARDCKFRLTEQELKNCDLEGE